MESGGRSSVAPSTDIQLSNMIDCPINNEDDDSKDENTPEVNDNGKRKRTSDVWNHFKRVVVDEIVYGECNYCKTRIKSPPNFGTSSLRKHYSSTCLKRPRKMDIRQSLMMANKKLNGSQELKSHIFNQEDSRRELAMMVILHEYPLSIVEHIGFRRFVSSLQPCFNMVSRNTLKNDIVIIYNAEKSKWGKLLDKLNCRVAITTDMWTSNNTKKGFMAVTAHFIDELWILQNCILRFIYVPAPHTTEVLSDVLAETLMDWNIDRKVSTITVDNCSTNDLMLSLLSDKVSRRDLLLNGEVLHMRCCAHILNLIVKDGLETISDAIEKIRDSVVYWTASASRIEKFEEVARQLNINCRKKLSLDCKTRWNSTYLMLETAITFKDVFPRVKYRERNYKSLPTDQDWENAKEICGKLKIFYEVTEMFSGTLYPTSNFYFPKICNIKVKLDEWVKSTSPILKSMAGNMLFKYQRYWDTCHILMGVAGVLDPRYKMILVEFYFPLIYGEKSSLKVAEVRQYCYDLLVDYQSRDGVSKQNISVGSGLGNTKGTSSCASTVLDAFENDPLEMYDKYVATRSNSTTATVSKTKELDIYLEERVLPRTENFDILSWWKTNGVKYPYLQKMAKDILAIPVTTVASESAFSTSGRLVTPHRSRLHPTTLEALMCARSWLSNNKNVSSTVKNSLNCPTMLDEEEELEECSK
ncbi:hypothetical protein ABFS82_08G217200 [Erythranthe guttata]